MKNWAQIKRWSFCTGLVLLIIGLALLVRSQWRLTGHIIYTKYLPSQSATLYIMDADGTHGKQLTNTLVLEVSSPVWSPDGEWIAFGCLISNHRSICVLDKDGMQLDSRGAISRPDMIEIENVSEFCSSLSGYDGYAVLSVSWAPGGQRLAFICPGAHNGDMVCITNLDGDLLSCWPVALLTEGVSKYSSVVVSWSPTSERLAISFWQGDSYSSSPKIYLVDPDGKNGVFLTDGAAPGWSPNGKRLAFVDSPYDKLYTINVDGSNKQLLYEKPVELKKFEDGSTNWTEWMLSGNLYLASGERIAWSPNAHYLVFVAYQNPAGNKPGIYIMNLMTKETTLLTILGDGLFYGPDWGP